MVARPVGDQMHGRGRTVGKVEVHHFPAGYCDMCRGCRSRSCLLTDAEMAVDSGRSLPLGKQMFQLMWMASQTQHAVQLLRMMSCRAMAFDASSYLLICLDALVKTAIRCKKSQRVEHMLPVGILHLVITDLLGPNTSSDLARSSAIESSFEHRKD